MSLSTNPPSIDILRARITYPDGIASPARFIYQRDGELTGRAAIWVEEKRPVKKATRVLLATGTFTRASSPREPHLFTTDLGTVWAISPLAGGGCGCNKRNSVIGSLSADQLLDPDIAGY